MSGKRRAMCLRLVEPLPEVVRLRGRARRLWTESVDALLAGEPEEWSRLRAEADVLEEEARELEGDEHRKIAAALTRVLDFAAHDSAPKGAA
jgi:hypothetical protein